MKLPFRAKAGIMTTLLSLLPKRNFAGLFKKELEYAMKCCCFWNAHEVRQGIE